MGRTKREPVLVMEWRVAAAEEVRDRIRFLVMQDVDVGFELLAVERYLTRVLKEIQEDSEQGKLPDQTFVLTEHTLHHLMGEDGSD